MADRLAIARTYVEQGYQLWLPRTYNLGTPDGITGVDLPIHEWLVALLMGGLGTQSPGVFRLYTLLWCLVAYFFLFRLTHQFTNAAWKGILACLFVFTCPIIMYYQIGMLPSPLGMAMGVIAYSTYFQYRVNEKRGTFFWAIAMMGLAAIVRTPFNIFLFALLLQESFYAWRSGHFPTWKWQTFALAYACIILAQAFKFYLTATYGTIFLDHLRPATNFSELWQLGAHIVERWAGQFLTMAHYILVVVLLGFIVAKLARIPVKKWIDNDLLLQASLATAGAFAYFPLMAKQFVDHEYYFLDSFYPALFLWLIIGLQAIPKQSKPWQWLPILMSIGWLGVASQQAYRVQQAKYAVTDWDRGEMTRKNYVGSDQLLDSLGISRSARILVIDAYSPNAPLLLMGRRGYTVLATKPQKIEAALKQEFDFLVQQDCFFPSDVLYNYPPLLKRLERIGGNGRVSVFRLLATDADATSIDRLLALGDTTASFELTFARAALEPNWTFSGGRSDSVFQSPPFAGLVRADQEFGPTLQHQLPVKEAGRRILFTGSVRTAIPGASFLIVTSISHSGQTIYYRSLPFRLENANEWRIFYSLFDVPAGLPAGSELKCYLWNPNRDELLVDDWEVLVYLSE